MKKNKYRWRTLRDEQPSMNTWIELNSGIWGKGNPPTIKAKLTGAGLIWEEEDGTIHSADNTDKWRPMKPKLNKYRWREMKDEKPEAKEEIILLEKFRFARAKIVTYLGCTDIKNIAGRPFVLLNFEGIGESQDRLIARDCDDFLWRKMCKLPGEK